MDQVFIKPNDGRRVRLESGMILPKDGMEVVRTTYVERRIKDEDAIVIPQPTEKPEVQKSASKKSKSQSTGGDV